jgi:hypothetical protein
MYTNDYALPFLTTFYNTLKEKTHKEVFVFQGTNESGITFSELTFPQQGYGFFCWLRLEQHSSDIQTMWKFKGEGSIELSIVNKKLRYSVTNAKSKEFEKELAEDKWYFIELYHVNTDEIENLVSLLNEH